MRHNQVLTDSQAHELARQCLDAIRLGKEPHPVEIERLCCFIVAVTRPLSPAKDEAQGIQADCRRIAEWSSNRREP